MKVKHYHRESCSNGHDYQANQSLNSWLDVLQMDGNEIIDIKQVYIHNNDHNLEKLNVSVMVREKDA